MWLKLLWNYWYVGVIVALIGSTAFQTHRLRNEQDNVKRLQIDLTRMEIIWEKQTQIAGEAQRKFDATKEQINANHEKLLAEAKETAVANFLRSRGAGAVRRGTACGVPAPTSVPATATPRTPDDSSTSDAAAADSGLDPITSALVTDCAATTVIATEFQQFVRLNELPISKE